MALILNATVPLFSVLLGLIIGKAEPLGWKRSFGVLVGFAGVACLFDCGGWMKPSPGQLAVLGAAVCYAAGAVYGKRFKEHPPLGNAAAMLSC
jgi:drug/metabolite transporter (DMT)-like permease